MLSRIGPWHAELTVDAPKAITGKVEIRIGKKNILKGTVSRGDMTEGRFHALVLAGGAGMCKVVTPKHYTSPTIRNVLSDLCANAGEAIADSADKAVLQMQLAHWTTAKMQAGTAIRLLVESAPAGTSWRMLPDGGLWVGQESWPSSDVTEFREVSQSPQDAVVEFGIEQPFLLPGTTLGDRKIDTVNIEIAAGAVRTKVWTAA